MRKNEENTVKLSLDLTKMPRLTAKQEAEIAAIHAMPDSEIDYSDLPELDDAFWAAAKRGLLPPAPKKQITLRLDEDVIEAFKTLGKGYQTRINAVLRAYVLTEAPRAATQLARGSDAG